MRLLVLCFAAIMSGTVPAAEDSAGAVVPLPEGWSLWRRADSELVQYRAPDGERWTLVTLRNAFLAPGDEADIKSSAIEQEERFRNLAEPHARTGRPFRLEKLQIDDQGVLLVFATQTNLNGKTHGLLDLRVF